MTQPDRDSLMAGEVALIGGERVLAEFRADRGTYWRAHLWMAAAFGVAAGAVLVALGNPDPWVGPVAALGAVAIRAWYLASEALTDRWRLTDRRLLGPRGQEMPRRRIRAARPFFGAVQVVTDGGDKHLIRYQADPAAVAAQIPGAR